MSCRSSCLSLLIFPSPNPSQQVLTRQLDQLMVHYDVLWIIQVAGERHHIRASELVCTIDSFIFPIRPENSILEKDRRVENTAHFLNQ